MTGNWRSPESGSAQRPSAASSELNGRAAALGLNVAHAGSGPGNDAVSVDGGLCTREHFMPAGSKRSADGTMWLVYVGDGDPPPF